jgi:DNA-binding Xre family transcriptional regulator
MNQKMGYRWNLRRIMAEHDMFATTDLIGPLAERGIVLSREQVFRLVTHPPARMPMDFLAAVCDIFAVLPNDLIDIEVVNSSVSKPASKATPARASIRSVTIRRPGSSS